MFIHHDILPALGPGGAEKIMAQNFQQAGTYVRAMPAISLRPSVMLGRSKYFT